MFTLYNTRFTDVTQAEVLQARCDQILQEIQSGNNGIPGPIRGDSYRELKAQYNRLANQLDDLRPRPSVDPLVALPPEIWTDILREAAIENGINLSSTEILLTLTSVSRHWTTTLLNAATLWTDITIGLGEADAQAKLGVGLCLSKGLPLKLIIYLVPCQWDKDLELLLPHANRIQEMEFLSSKRSAFAIGYDSESFEQTFSSLGPLPSLISIRNSLGFQPIWHNFANTPVLASIYDMPIPLSALKPRTGLLRACQVQATSSEIITNIEDLTLLEDLTWDVQEEEPGTQISSTIVTKLPALRQISADIKSDANFFRVIKLADNLTSLIFYIRDNWQHLYDIFHLFPHLPRLRHIDLTMGKILGNLIWPDIEITETNVIELGISYSGRNHESKETSSNQETLCAILPLYFPNVTQFHVRFTVHSAGVAAYIRSAKHLVFLDLFLMRQPEYEVSLESSSLESLALFGGDDLLARLTKFTCPLLSNLSLHLYNHENDVYDWNHLRSKYSHHERFKILRARALGKICELRALRRIRVFNHQGILGLLQGLIVNPSGCPALAEIELSEIPEWDLLFIMLERRNYIPKSQGIARIETVILPSPIPSALLVPLVEILAGRFTERPSNWDLSFSALMETYFDPSIPGCERCIMSLSTCSTAMFSADPPDSLIWRHMELPIGEADIPVEVWAWLQKRHERVDGWNERADEWMRGPQGQRGLQRVRRCSDMDLVQQPFILTAFSLVGLA